jgi:hypothetical protein
MEVEVTVAEEVVSVEVEAEEEEGVVDVTPVVNKAISHVNALKEEEEATDSVEDSKPLQDDTLK